MAPRFRLLIGVILAGVRGDAEEFSLGSIEKGATIEFTLPFTISGADGNVGSVVTDCDCLTPLENSVGNGSAAIVQRTFKYRSPNTGRIRVNVWLKADNAEHSVHHTVTGYVYDRSWLISAEEAKNEAGSALVDTRWPQQYGQVHIPRSLNLPAFALTSRAELRGRRIVLVDGGFTSAEQFTLAETLRLKGFRDVVCLRGGIPAWLRSGGRYEGTSADPVVAASTITAIDFARAQVSGAWIVVELPPDPTSSSAPSVEGLNRLASVLREHRSPEGLSASVLIVGKNDALYAKAERANGRAEERGPYYLAGGIAALEAFQNEQRALASRKPELFQTQIASGRPLMGNGCGSCPKR